MIVRKPLICNACGTKTLTRAQIGHGTQQSHSFGCPECGIEISFTLDLFPDEGRVKYRDPKNSRWADNDEGVTYVLTFASELPVPQLLAKSAVEPDAEAGVVRAGFSPFLSTIMNLRDFNDYAEDERARTGGLDQVWPVIERLVNHFEKGNEALFDSELASVELEADSPTLIGRLLLLERVSARFLRLFALYTRGQRDRVRQRIALARSISRPLFEELGTLYLQSGRLSALWREIWAVRRAFLRIYAAFRPIIYVRYWEEDLQDLSSLAVSDKRFHDLRQLYIDCFETFCRLMVLAIAMETIIHDNRLKIPTKKGSMTLWEFDKMRNGLKPDHLGRYPIFDLFVPEIDSKLRNGIGHHSAHYVAESDSIEYEIERESQVVTDSLSYTVFCDRVLRLYTAFELATLYFHTVHVQAGGTV